ncbi:myo-inosose-2 dehydratase [Sandaracinus amylolyticus]|uniref:myo-inosose-2 dehydratase n=1 Tax=Sandaracinus amylolyticus TaxID=927083 RepID=UPI001F2D6AFF|nr:myo-inosose-2 dehydratase [Sandaracinus amylolyticus]UJR84567.1 Hypothetical protein I5071_66460 [Sandaracinus amylolyticus]
MRIGVNPLIWINDDKPELGADVPLERCLSEARAAGYAGIELGHRFPRTALELRPLLARHRLSLISGWYSAQLVERGAERELERLGPHLELLRAMRCDTLVLAETTGAVHREMRPLSRRPVLDRATWQGFVRELERLAVRARAQGIRVAYHPHVGTVVQTADEVERLMQDTSDDVGLLLDTGHFAYAAASPRDGDAAIRACIARHGERVVHVHLKDVRAEVLARAIERDVPFLDAVCEGVFTVPGDGALALEPAIAELARRRYRGWWVVEAEQDPAIAHPLTYAKLGFANAARWVASWARRARRLRAPIVRATTRRDRSGLAARTGHARARRSRV